MAPSPLPLHHLQLRLQLLHPASGDAVPQCLLLNFALSGGRRTSVSSLGFQGLLLNLRVHGAQLVRVVLTASPEAISASGSGTPANAGTLAASTTSGSPPPPPTLGALGRSTSSERSPCFHCRGHRHSSSGTSSIRRSRRGL